MENGELAGERVKFAKNILPRRRQSSGAGIADDVLEEIAGTPSAHGDARLQDLLVKDTDLRILGKTAGGELGGILRQLNLQALGDQDGCNIGTLKEFLAQRVIGGILFGDEPLTPVKAGILAVVTKPGDSRIREIVAKKLNLGALDWMAIAGLQF